MSPTRLTRLDALLLLMVIIWGTNYSVIKIAFRDMEPQAFNAVRMILASAVFLAIIFGVRWIPPERRSSPAAAPGALASIFHTPAPVTPRDWLRLAALGIVGHFLYQYLFIGGLARTTVANSSLMLAATPVVIALLSAAMGAERIGRLHWIGAALSIAGIYLIVGRGMTLGGPGFTGDVMMFGALCCWTFYTLAARPLMERHSPVAVTGLSMAMGTALYVLVMGPKIAAVRWLDIDLTTWMACVYSALFALCVAYTIWYAAVRELGSARTAVYSNLMPIIAMLTAVVFLGEPLGLMKVAGAAAVLVGVALTRMGDTRLPIPAEE